MKKFLLLLLATLLICLTGCDKPNSYSFQNDINEISQISICYVECPNDIFKVIHVIDDINSFLLEFESIKFERMRFGDPVRLNEEYAILIEYRNGDSEMIGYKSQKITINGEIRTLRFFCDKEIFTDFVNKYLKIS